MIFNWLKPAFLHITLIASCVLLLLSVAIIYVPAASTNFLLVDGFENGSLSGWVSPGISPKITTNPVHSGSYSANCTFTSAACYATKTITPTNTLNYTYYVYFSVLPSNYACINLASDANNTKIYYRLQLMDGAYQWRFSVGNMEIINATTPPATANQWFKIQLLAKTGQNSTFYFLVNDQMKATLTNQTFGAINKLYFGNDWIDFGAFLPQGASFFDDLTVTDTITNFISAFNEGNGTITPNGAISVNFGSNQVFTIKPGAHYHISDVLVDDHSMGPITTYTFYNVSSIHSIIAIFKIDTYNITASAGPNGAISPSGVVVADWDSSQTFRFTPNSGYHVSEVRVNGSSVGAVESYTISNIQSDNSITVAFQANPTPTPSNPPMPTDSNKPKPTPTPTSIPTATPTVTQPTPSPTASNTQNTSIDYFQFGIIAVFITAMIIIGLLLARKRNNVAEYPEL